MALNKVILIGNVGQEPQIRQTQGGSPIANFTLATTERWKDKMSGEQKSKTEWHRIVVFGDLAKVVENYVKKGDKLYIEGSLQTRKWQDNNGLERQTTEIILQGYGSKLEMLDRKSSGDLSNDSPSDKYNEDENYVSNDKPAKKPAKSVKSSSNDEGEEEGFDEVPF
jgi:single-strand DNA-binding protein